MQPNDVASWSIRITGKVQGVSFRAYAKREALRLHLAGSVHNQADGSVAIVAEGPVGSLEHFRAWCEEGPPHARVHQVDVTPIPATGAREFTIS